MGKITARLAALLLALFVGLLSGSPAFATPHVFEGDTPSVAEEQTVNVNDQVCPPLSSGKIDVGPGVTSKTITADPGYVLTRYCVKAGSSNHGDGPLVFTIAGENVTTYTFSYPEKDISHYSYEQVPLVATPVKTVIDEQPEAPNGFDYCGTNYDAPDTSMYDASLPFTVNQTVLGNQTTIELIPDVTHYFADGIVTKWTFTYTDTPCPVFIVERPAAPTLCYGRVVLQNDTDQYFYGGDGDNVFAIAKEGHLFVQDLLEEGLDYIVWPVKDLKETCESAEVPPVTVPVTDTPPVVEVPSVTNVPPAVKETPPAIAPVAPVSADIEPVTAAPAASTSLVAVDDDVANASVASEGLANTGSGWLALALVLTGMLLAAGLGLRFGGRLRFIKK
jgi:hypothetical protein